MNYHLLSLALCSTLTAASALELKGMTPGMDLGKAMELHGGLKCNSERDHCTMVTPTLGWDPARPRKLEEAGELMIFGGSLTKGWVVEAKDFRIGRISVILESENFDDLAPALSEKFGKPKASSQVVQNRMGAKFQNLTLTWVKGDLRLQATKYSGGSLDEMSVVLSSTKYEKRLLAEEPEKIKRRAKGL